MIRTPRFSASRGPSQGPAWLALAFLFLLALPAVAQTEDQDPAIDAPARFLIETIAVEGVDRPATREIVAKESRIALGTEIDEDDLRQAIYRVRRLPFVIDADFALRKGSERGRYELVIRIEMASSIFADLAVGTNWERGEPGGGELDWFGAVGARRFVGARGYAFGSIDRFRNLQLGYTQFHLFGPGSYLSAAASTNLEDDYDGYNLSLSAGKPLTATQALRASVGYGDSDLSTGRSANLDWSLDTTDDPLLPTQGTLLSVGGGYSSSDQTFRFNDAVFISKSSFSSLGAFGRRFWPLASRHSVWGELAASHQEFKSSSFGEPDSRASSENASAGLGYTWDLLRSQVGEPRNDLRFSTLGYLNSSNDPFDSGFRARDLYLEASLIYRRPQGSIRLVFSYRDSFERRLTQ